MDGKGEFTTLRSEPLGGEPSLVAPRPDSGAQKEQGTHGASPAAANDPAAHRKDRPA